MMLGCFLLSNLEDKIGNTNGVDKRTNCNDKHYMYNYIQNIHISTYLVTRLWVRYFKEENTFSWMKHHLCFLLQIFFLCLWRLKNVKFCVFVDLRYLNEYFDLTLSFFNVFGKESETWWTTDKLPRLIFKTYEYQ